MKIGLDNWVKLVYIILKNIRNVQEMLGTSRCFLSAGICGHISLMDSIKNFVPLLAALPVVQACCLRVAAVLREWL